MTVLSARFPAFAVTLLTKQFHPVAAVGIVNIPAEVAQPVPTLIRKDAVPLFTEIDGDEQKPLKITGAEFEMRRFVSLIVVNFPELGVVAPIDTLLIVAPLIFPEDVPENTGLVSVGAV